MTIEFRCEGCERGYRVAENLAGRRFACKQCGQPVVVPMVPQQAAPVRVSQPLPAAASRPAPAAAAPTPYGASPEQPYTGPMKRKPNIVFMIGAFAMFLGFFLPWISIDAIVFKMSWGGYELPGGFNSLMDMAISSLEKGTGAEQQEQLNLMREARSRGNFLYLIYLIPALTFAAFIEELVAMQKGRNFWWLRTLAAASPLIAFVAVMVAFSGLDGPSTPSRQSSAEGNPFDLFKILGAGFYISILGFVAATVGIFTSPKATPARAVVLAHRPAGPRPAGTLPGAPAGPRPRLKPRLPGKPKLPGPRA